MASSTPQTPSATDQTQMAAQEAPFQFRIRDLLLVMLLVALALAAAAQQSGLLAALLLFAGIGCLAFWNQWSAASVLTILGILGALVILFFPAIDHPRTPARSTTCRINLEQIVWGLQSYHEVYGSFPPAYVADKSGRPMHSWRVFILPFIEHQNLYSQYRFDEPWDGPNNRKLADQIMRVYSCPDQHWKTSTETSYVAIIGPHTAWPGEKAARLTDFQDGPANVLLVVEVHDSGIHWMEPRDLHVTQMAPTINAPHGQGISSDHNHNAHAAFADGMTRRLPETLPADVLRSWINVDDGTQMPPP